MATYSLCCVIDGGSQLQTLQDGKYSLCVTYKSELDYPIIKSAPVNDVAVFLQWTDTYYAYAQYGAGFKFTTDTIQFTRGEAIKLQKVDSVEILALESGVVGPKDGVQFDTDIEARLVITQDFGSNIKPQVSSDTYKKSTHISLPLDMNIWFQANAVDGEACTVASADQYTIEYTNTNTRTIYFDGVFSLQRPQFYAAGTVLGFSIDKGDYVISQPLPRHGTEERSARVSAMGSLKAQRAITFSEGPVTMNGFLDQNSYEIAVEVSIMGIDLGVLCGNLKKGFNINLHLAGVAGTVRLYERDIVLTLWKHKKVLHQVVATINLSIPWAPFYKNDVEEKTVLTWTDDKGIPFCRAPDSAT